MKRSYVFVYSDEVGTREQVREFLHNLAMIETWRFELPNTFFLVSEANANEIADKILRFTGKKGSFLITEYSPNSQGWLVQRSWTVLNKKYLPPKGKDA